MPTPVHERLAAMRGLFAPTRRVVEAAARPARSNTPTVSAAQVFGRGGMLSYDMRADVLMAASAFLAAIHGLEGFCTDIV